MRPRFLLLFALISCCFAQNSTAALDGQTVNALTGAPVPNVRIRLALNLDDPVFAKSDEDGRFRFENLKLESYTLRVDAPGFLEPDYRNVCITRVDPPKEVIRLTPSAVITGRVTDPDGVPLEGAYLELLAKRHAGMPPGPPWMGNADFAPLKQGATNDKGEYRFAGLKPGTYYVVVNRGHLVNSAWESTYQATYFGGVTDLSSAKPMELAAGQQVRADIRVVRQAGVRVAGRIIKPPGAPSGRASLLYTNLTLVPAGDAMMNPNSAFVIASEDEYEFKAILPGKYTLMALTRDATSDPFGHNQKMLYGLQRPIEVGDRDIDGLDLALAPLRDVPGEVIFREGCPIFLVRIRVVDDSRLAWGRPEVMTNGKFVLTGLTVGRATLNVEAPVVDSVRLGDRDVQKDGLVLPDVASEPLRITIGCMPSGRLQ